MFAIDIYSILLGIVTTGFLMLSGGIQVNLFTEIRLGLEVKFEDNL